uniref:Pre-mRNA-splicing factor CWC25 homolog n=1 Tax=Cacopsylla melanoneura TaxID=428564 RepID=A0A8D9FC07_9HEMI
MSHGKNKSRRDESPENKNRHRSKANDEKDTNKKNHSSSERQTNDNQSSSKKKHKSETKTSHDQNSSEDEKNKQQNYSGKYGLLLPGNYKAPSKSDHQNSKVKASTSKPAEEPKKISHHKKVKLSEEEKEQKLKEMMDNAKWRDDLREKNIKEYQKEAEKEKEKYNEKYEKDKFMRKQLSIAAEHSSVESRLRSNINNIQRSSHAMSSPFDRRL